MKIISLKLAVGLVALIFAASIWLGLMLMLRYSGSSPLITLGVYLSHLSVFGWLLFLILTVVIYKLAVRNLMPRFAK